MTDMFGLFAPQFMPPTSPHLVMSAGNAAQQEANKYVEIDGARYAVPEEWRGRRREYLEYLKQLKIGRVYRGPLKAARPEAPATVLNALQRAGIIQR